MRGYDMRHRVRTGVPAVLAVLGLVGALLVWRHDAVPVPVASATHDTASPHAEPAVPHRFSALFAGDDFTKGVLGSTWASYPCILARVKGWDCDVDAQAATGFVADGRSYGDHSTRRLADRLDLDRRLYAVDMVFVDAGRNDLAILPDTVVTAVNDYLTRVLARWPTAKVVVLMPFWMQTGPYGNYNELRAGFAAAVAKAHGVLLDPLAEHWFDGQPLTRMVITDGVHPNALGNQTIATDIADSLARHGLADLGGASR
jgi:lysophospholipase L1-like esterase